MALLTEMISVSLTEQQTKDLTKEATKQNRKVGAVARIFIAEGLKKSGYSVEGEGAVDEQ